MLFRFMGPALKPRMPSPGDPGEPVGGQPAWDVDPESIVAWSVVFSDEELKKKPPRRGGFSLKRSLAVTYSRMASHTTIGAAAFHFRVRDGIGWYHSAIAAREGVRTALVERQSGKDVNE